MATTIINSHQVEDFAKWKQGFDAGADMRTQVGIVIKGVYQTVNDENLVIIISEVESPDVAMALMSNPEMQEAMKKVGVISTPEIKILNEIL